jgi:hypothetical protein
MQNKNDLLKVWPSGGVMWSLYPYIYKNLRIAKFLDFMVLNDSIDAHACIKIHTLLALSIKIHKSLKFYVYKKRNKLFKF